jgi:hypothetical protein
MPHLARARSIIDNKGIGSEASYPYTATDGTCKTVPSVATITGYTDVPANSETALETAIVQQPISVAVEADQASFQLYSGGVMTAACGTALDHGVLAVGYGTLSGADYYKVKVRRRGGGWARRGARAEWEEWGRTRRLLWCGATGRPCLPPPPPPPHTHAHPQNSWGASWGMSGYILLGRGSAFNPAGQCGIQMAASYPNKA